MDISKLRADQIAYNICMDRIQRYLGEEMSKPYTQLPNMTIMHNSYKKYYTQYKGLWYRYHPLLNQWWLYHKDFDGTEHEWFFSADRYRIDQCIREAVNMWVNEILKGKPEVKWYFFDEVGQFDFEYVKSKSEFLGILITSKDGSKQFVENKANIQWD